MQGAIEKLKSNKSINWEIRQILEQILIKMT